MTSAISLNNILFSWDKNASASPILDIPQWQVAKGERVFLQGRSGTGKSTLLALLSGINLPQQGSITLMDQDISQLKASQRDRFRAQSLGVIFQQFNLLPYLSVSDNIRLGGYFSGQSLDSQRIDELCDQLALERKLLTQPAHSLSIGQQQRVAIARALFHRPPIILADEPTSALDAYACEEFIALLLEQSQQTNSTVVFVSHDTRLATQFDRVDNLAEINQANSKEASC